MEFIFTFSTVVLLVSYCLFYGFTLISNMCCARECSSLYVLHFVSLSLHVFFCSSLLSFKKWMLIYLRALTTFYLLCYSFSYYVCLLFLYHFFFVVVVVIVVPARVSICRFADSFDFFSLVFATLFYCLRILCCYLFFLLHFLYILISLDLLPNGYAKHWMGEKRTVYCVRAYATSCDIVLWSALNPSIIDFILWAFFMSLFLNVSCIFSRAKII